MTRSLYYSIGIFLFLSIKVQALNFSTQESRVNFCSQLKKGQSFTNEEAAAYSACLDTLNTKYGNIKKSATVDKKVSKKNPTKDKPSPQSNVTVKTDKKNSDDTQSVNLNSNCSPQNLSSCIGVISCQGLNNSHPNASGVYFWNELSGSCVLQSKSYADESVEDAAPVAQLSKTECANRLAEAEAACYESKTDAVSSCEYSESETAQSVQTATNQITAVVQQMNTGNLGTAGSLGSISNMTMGAKAALAGMQGKCAYSRNSCINSCAAAKKIIEACREHPGLIKVYEPRVYADAEKCGDLENSLQAMDDQMAGLLTAANGLTNICEQASYKNNPICTNGSLAGLNSPSGIVDCFANPSHSSCQVAPGTNSKLNTGLATLPTATTNGRGGAGIVGGLSGGGDGTDYGNFKLNNESNLKDVKVPSAKMLPGDGGGGGMGGGGAGGALGGGSNGSSPAGGNNNTGGVAGSDLDLNFAKLNGDDTIARRMGMGSSGGAGAKGLPYQRDKNGNLIYPDARSLKFNMNRFRPSLGGGRGIAGSSTLGPDGITDGNSDLWKKINIQYNSQEDTLD